uniref:(northern house mosquito) hypothetical protein n=1 Tax=Culex pipiens TaxID=7175 RepID=A0A8D8G0S9_CULPI
MLEVIAHFPPKRSASFAVFFSRFHGGPSKGERIEARTKSHPDRVRAPSPHTYTPNTKHTHAKSVLPRYRRPEISPFQTLLRFVVHTSLLDSLGCCCSVISHSVGFAGRRRRHHDHGWSR